MDVVGVCHGREDGGDCGDDGECAHCELSGDWRVVLVVDVVEDECLGYDLVDLTGCEFVQEDSADRCALYNFYDELMSSVFGEMLVTIR